MAAEISFMFEVEKDVMRGWMEAQRRYMRIPVRRRRVNESYAAVLGGNPLWGFKGCSTAMSLRT
jgi:hypothetical protein